MSGVVAVLVGTPEVCYSARSAELLARTYSCSVGSLRGEHQRREVKGEVRIELAWLCICSLPSVAQRIHVLGRANIHIVNSKCCINLIFVVLAAVAAGPAASSSSQLRTHSLRQLSCTLACRTPSLFNMMTLSSAVVSTSSCPRPAAAASGAAVCVRWLAWSNSSAKPRPLQGKQQRGRNWA